MAQVTVVFRSGWQQPFRPGDRLLVYPDLGHEPLAELSAALVLRLVAHYLGQAELVTELLAGGRPLAAMPARPSSGSSAFSLLPHLAGAQGRRLRGYARGVS